MKDSYIGLGKNALIALLFAVTILSGIFKNSDYDSWYHLKAGEILFCNKSFPEYDPFYYSLHDQPFTRGYWLFQVVLYAMYKTAGFNGITVLQCITLFLTIFFVYKVGKLKTSSFSLSILVPLAVIMNVQDRFRARPEMFGAVCFSCCIYLINLYLVKKQNYLFLIPFIHILWVNSHTSFVFGLVLLFIYAIGSVFNNLYSRFFIAQDQKIINKTTIIFFILFIISVLSTLLNPDNVKTFKGLFQFYFSTQHELLLQIVEELQGYSLKHDLFTFFSLVLLVCALSFIARIKRIDFSELFLFILFAYLSIHAMRFKSFFMVVSGLILFSNLDYLNRLFAKKDIKILIRSVQLQYLVLPILIILVGLYMTGMFTGPYIDYQFGFGASFTQAPVKLVDFIERNNVTGKMFNPTHYGGYLEWRLYPKQKVFIDGRMLGNTQFRNEYYQMNLHKEDWENAQKKYGFDYVIIEYSQKDGLDYLTALLVSRDDYKIVYFDNFNILFLKNNTQNEKLIASLAFKYISPLNIVMEKLGTEFPYDEEIRTDAKNELLRLLSSNDDLEKAHSYLGSIYQMEKEYAKALIEYNKALQIEPLISGVHHNLGMIYYERSEYNKAIDEWNKELTIVPNSIKTRIALARIYMMMSEYQKSKEQCAFILKKEPGNKIASDFLQWMNANGMGGVVPGH